MRVKIVRIMQVKFEHLLATIRFSSSCLSGEKMSFSFLCWLLGELDTRYTA
jgi:hypothetical protein